MQPMVANTHKTFVERLIKACENASPPIPDGRGLVRELYNRYVRAYPGETDTKKSVSYEAVRGWVRGDKSPSMEKARNLAALLGVSSNWLNDGMGEMKPSSHANKQGKAQETGTPSANEPRPTEYHDPPIIEEVVAMMRLLDELGQHEVLGAARLALSQQRLRTNDFSSATGTNSRTGAA